MQDHHDYLDHNINNQQGVRVLTSYLYLNDVEAGGGTMFTGLNITVMPKRGRALFWPSVLDDSPHDKDSRTNHQGTAYIQPIVLIATFSFAFLILKISQFFYTALPVEAGIKYGANGWYHQFDFKVCLHH
jgi:hypothetical protein